MLKSVYWDACVFHALLGEESGRVESCKEIEKQARDGLVTIYTSAVTLTECVWLKGKERIAKNHEDAIQKYFMHKYIVVVNCDRLIAEQARALVWQYGIKPKDSIHVATALAMQVDIMHTYDNADLVKWDGKIGIPALKIENPPAPAPTKMKALAEVAAFARAAMPLDEEVVKEPEPTPLAVTESTAPAKAGAPPAPTAVFQSWLN